MCKLLWCPFSVYLALFSCVSIQPSTLIPNLIHQSQVNQSYPTLYCAVLSYLSVDLSTFPLIYPSVHLPNLPILKYCKTWRRIALQPVWTALQTFVRNLERAGCTRACWLTIEYAHACKCKDNPVPRDSNGPREELTIPDQKVHVTRLKAVHVQTLKTSQDSLSVSFKLTVDWEDTGLVQRLQSQTELFSKGGSARYLFLGMFVRIPFACLSLYAFLFQVMYFATR